MYGHAESVKEGVIAGGSATTYQIPETDEVLAKMHAPPKPDYPIISVEQLTPSSLVSPLVTVTSRHSGRHSGTPRGGLWEKGALAGKYAGVFVSTGTPGGGQEATVMNPLSAFVHHGIVFVPLGYSHPFSQLFNVSEAHGGSPWGAGAFAGGDGSRHPSALKLEIAKILGTGFYETISPKRSLSTFAVRNVLLSRF